MILSKFLVHHQQKVLLIMMFGFLLNEKQQEAIEEKYNRMVIYDEIEVILNTKLVSFVNCENTIHRYFQFKHLPSS